MNGEFLAGILNVSANEEWALSQCKQAGTLHVGKSPLAHDQKHAVSRKTITSRPHGKEQERKLTQQMMVAGARTSEIEKWGWGQGIEYRNGLMRPEITHSLLKITVELADILGIALDEVK